MHASLLLHQQQQQVGSNMMLTYPQATLLHGRPATVLPPPGAIIPQPLAHGFPVALPPGLLQQSHSPGLRVDPAKSSNEVTRPTTASSPPAKPSHSSFSIDSILGTKNSEKKEAKIALPQVHHLQPATTRTTTTASGLFYFYGPTQPSFPFATATRSLESELQRSPLGPIVISSSGRQTSHHPLQDACIWCSNARYSYYFLFYNNNYDGLCFALQIIIITIIMVVPSCHRNSKGKGN
jgi:hypothetical protein